MGYCYHGSKLIANKAPCHFDDLIEVSMKIREIASKTITYDFQISRKNDGKLAAEGFLKCIAVDLNWKVVQLPAELVKAIRDKQE
jgi:acyl-CoA thioesterase FadM